MGFLSDIKNKAEAVSESAKSFAGGTQNNSYEAYQANLSTPKQEAPWTTRRVLGNIYQINKYDPQKAAKMYSDLMYLQTQKTSKYYNPYAQVTNKAVAELQSYGVDCSKIDDDFFKKNDYLRQYLIYNGTTNEPSKPTGKKATTEQKAAYAFWQIYKSRDDTDKAEREWEALKHELSYWATQADRNYSDDYIISHIDWNKYKTLASMDEKKQFNPMELNRAIGYSKDNMYGVLWAARNGGGSGDFLYDTMLSGANVGKKWKYDEKIASMSDPSSKEYSPYALGSTMDDERLYFGVSKFDDKWIEENRLRYRGSDDETAKKYFANVVDAEEYTKKLESQLKELLEDISILAPIMKADELIDNYYGDDPDDSRFRDLFALDKTIEKGEPKKTTRAVNYRRQDIEKLIREKCEKAEGDHIASTLAGVTGKEGLSEAESALAEYYQEKVKSVLPTIVDNGTEDEKAVLPTCGDTVMHEAVQGRLTEGDVTPQKTAHDVTVLAVDEVSEYTRTIYDYEKHQSELEATKKEREKYADELEALRQLRAASEAMGNLSAEQYDRLMNIENMPDFEEVLGEIAYGYGETRKDGTPRAMSYEDALASLYMYVTGDSNVDLGKAEGWYNYLANSVNENPIQKLIVNASKDDVDFEEQEIGDFRISLERNDNGEFEFAGADNMVTGEHYSSDQMDEVNSKLGFNGGGERITDEQAERLSMLEMRDMELADKIDSLEGYIEASRSTYEDALNDEQFLLDMWETVASVSGGELEESLIPSISYATLVGQEYVPTKWTAYSAYDVAVSDGVMTKDQAVKTALSVATSYTQELDMLLTVMNRMDEVGVYFTDEERNNIKRRVDALKRDALGAGYYSVQGHADFEKVVSSMKSDTDALSEAITITTEAMEGRRKGLFDQKYAYSATDSSLQTLFKIGHNLHVDMEEGATLATMSDDEFNTFLYLLKKDGKDAARDYLDFILDPDYGNVTVRKSEDRKEAIREFASSGFFQGAISYAASFVNNLVSTPYALEYILRQRMSGNEVSPHNSAFSYQDMTVAARQGVKESLAIATGGVRNPETGAVEGGSKIADMLFEAITSSVDSMANAAVTGSVLSDVGTFISSSKLGGAIGKLVDGASKWLGKHPKLASAVAFGANSAESVAHASYMGLNAATAAYKNAIINGGTDTQAMQMAYATFFAETVSETITFSNLQESFNLGKDSARKGLADFIVKFFKNGAEEFFGESVNELAEDVADRLIMGAMSDYEKTVQLYVDAGYPESVARDIADKETWKNVLKAGAIGFLSSGVGSVAENVAGRLSRGKAEEETVTAPAPSSIPGTKGALTPGDVTTESGVNAGPSWRNSGEAISPEDVLKSRSDTYKGKVLDTFSKEIANPSDGSYGDLLRQNRLTEQRVTTPRVDASAKGVYSRRQRIIQDINDIYRLPPRAYKPFSGSYGDLLRQGRLTPTESVAPTNVKGEFEGAFGRYKQRMWAEARAFKETEQQKEQFNNDLLKDAGMLTYGYVGDKFSAVATMSAVMRSGNSNVDRLSSMIMVNTMAKGKQSNAVHAFLEILGRARNLSEMYGGTIATYNKLKEWTSYAAITSGKAHSALQSIFDSVASGKKVTLSDVADLIDGVMQDKAADTDGSSYNAALHKYHVAAVTNEIVANDENQKKISEATEAVKEAQRAEAEAKKVADDAHSKAEAIAQNLETVHSEYVPADPNAPVSKENMGQVQQTREELVGALADAQQKDAVHEAQKTKKVAKKRKLKETQQQVMAQARAEAEQTVAQQEAEEQAARQAQAQAEFEKAVQQYHPVAPFQAPIRVDVYENRDERDRVGSHPVAHTQITGVFAVDQNSPSDNPTYIFTTPDGYISGDLLGNIPEEVIEDYDAATEHWETSSGNVRATNNPVNPAVWLSQSVKATVTIDGVDTLIDVVGFAGQIDGEPVVMDANGNIYDTTEQVAFDQDDVDFVYNQFDGAQNLPEVSDAELYRSSTGVEVPEGFVKYPEGSVEGQVYSENGEEVTVNIVGIVPTVSTEEDVANEDNERVQHLKTKPNKKGKKKVADFSYVTDTGLVLSWEDVITSNEYFDMWADSVLEGETEEGGFYYAKRENGKYIGYTNLEGYNGWIGKAEDQPYELDGVFINKKTGEPYVAVTYFDDYSGDQTFEFYKAEQFNSEDQDALNWVKEALGKLGINKSSTKKATANTFYTVPQVDEDSEDTKYTVLESKDGTGFTIPPTEPFQIMFDPDIYEESEHENTMGIVTGVKFGAYPTIEVIAPDGKTQNITFNQLRDLDEADYKWLIGALEHMKENARDIPNPEYEEGAVYDEYDEYGDPVDVPTPLSYTKAEAADGIQKTLDKFKSTFDGYDFDADHYVPERVAEKGKKNPETGEPLEDWQNPDNHGAVKEVPKEVNDYLTGKKVPKSKEFQDFISKIPERARKLLFTKDGKPKIFYRGYGGLRGAPIFLEHYGRPTKLPDGKTVYFNFYADSIDTAASYADSNYTGTRKSPQEMVTPFREITNWETAKAAMQDLGYDLEIKSRGGQWGYQVTKNGNAIGPGAEQWNAKKTWFMENELSKFKQAYGGELNHQGIFAGYISVQNPLIIDAHGSSYEFVTAEVNSEDGESSVGTKRVRNWAEWAFKHGYDSLIVTNVTDNLDGGGDIVTDVVTSQSNQFKSVYNFGNWSKSDNVLELRTQRGARRGRSVLETLMHRGLTQDFVDAVQRWNNGESVPYEAMMAMPAIQWAESHMANGESLSFDTQQKLKNAAKTTDEYVKSVEALFDPERVEEQHTIRDAILNNGSAVFDENGKVSYSGNVNRNRRADVIIGLPGSSKSTIADRISAKNGSLIVDNDMVKEMFKDYKHGLNTAYLHTESRFVLDQVYDAATSDGTNIVLPIVGHNYSSVARQLAQLQEEGYDVHLHMADLDQNKAIGRALSRFISDGRYVTLPYLMGKDGAGLSAEKIKATYEQLKKGDLVDGYTQWNTDVKKGENPILVETSESDSGQLFTQYGVPLGRDNRAETAPVREGTSEKQKPEVRRTPLTPTEKQARKVRNTLVSPQRIAHDLVNGLGIGNYLGSNYFGVYQDDVGYYDKHARLVAVKGRDIGDYKKTMHEAGHAVAHLLGLTATDRMVDNLIAEDKSFEENYEPNERKAEATAEFFWRYLESEQRAREFAGDAYVDDFETQLMNNPKINAAVKTAKQQLRMWVSASDIEKGAALVRYEKDSNYKSISRQVKEMITRTIDDTSIAQEVSNYIGDNSLREQALFANHSQKRSIRNLTSDLTDANGTITGKKGLAARIADTGYDMSKIENRKALDNYLLYKHSLDRDKQGFPMYANLTTEQRQNALKEMEKAYPHINDAANAFQEFRRDYLQAWMVDTGYWTQEFFDHLNEIYPNYCPVVRVGDVQDSTGNPFGNRSEDFIIHEVKGGTQDIYSPMYSFVGMVDKITSMIATNQIAQVFDDAYQHNEGMGFFGREIYGTENTHLLPSGSPEHLNSEQAQLQDLLKKHISKDLMQEVLEIVKSNPGEGNVTSGQNILRVHRRDGTIARYEIHDVDLYKLLTGVQSSSGIKILRNIGNATRMMTMLTTGSNPLFAVRNAARDYQNSINYGTWASNYLTGIPRWAKAFVEVWRGESDAVKQYYALGGGGWTYIEQGNSKNMAQISNEMFGSDKLRDNTDTLGHTAKWAGKKLLKLVTMEHLNEAIEQTSRFVEYKYGNHDLSTAEGRQKAFLAAQDVTVDFSRGGNNELSYVLKQLVPFFSASVQGVYRTARQFTQSERGRNGETAAETARNVIHSDAARRFTKTVVNTALMSALASALVFRFGDDDDKEEFLMLSDGIKANHLILPNPLKGQDGQPPFLRIPLAQDPLGYAVHNVVTNAMVNGSEDETAITLAATADVILDNLNPVGSGTIFRPFTDVSHNQTWYGTPIVRNGQADWTDPASQFNEDTPEIFKTLGRLTNTSPEVIEYLASQYTGFIGAVGIPALTVNPDGSIGGFDAIMKSFTKKWTADPANSNNITNNYYGMKETLTTITSEAKKERPQGLLLRSLTQSQVDEAYEEASAMLKSGGVAYEAGKIIDEAYKEIDRINANDTLTDADKYERTNAIKLDMLRQVQNANDKMQAYLKKYVTGETLTDRVFGAIRKRTESGAYAHIKTDAERLPETFQNDSDSEYMRRVMSVYNGPHGTDLGGGKASALPHPEQTFKLTLRDGSKQEYTIPDGEWAWYTEVYKGEYQKYILTSTKGRRWETLGNEDKYSVLVSAATSANKKMKEMYAKRNGIRTK